MDLKDEKESPCESDAGDRDGELLNGRMPGLSLTSRGKVGFHHRNDSRPMKDVKQNELREGIRCGSG